MNEMIKPEEVIHLQAQITVLSEEHRGLDEQITSLMLHPEGDELLVRRLKKQKLFLKDKIVALERMLHPGDFA